jgi:hypothetical protein
LAEQRANDAVTRATATPDVTSDHWRVPGGESKWKYDDQPDQMGRGVTKFAHVNSVTTLNFGFPYQGPQQMRLVLRNSPKHGKDAFLTIQQGQFHIRYPHSNFTVRFDNRELHTFPFDPASDGSSEVAFLGSGQYDRFIRLLRQAKKMDIEVDFFSEGSQVVSFDVDGLQGW